VDEMTSLASWSIGRTDIVTGEGTCRLVSLGVNDEIVGLTPRDARLIAATLVSMAENAEDDQNG
jgi:hypothetical protein